MALTDEIERLSVLHANGSLTDDEFAAAKAKLIEDAAAPMLTAPTPDVTARLDDLTQQNALLQLDHDWERQRQSFMMRGRYGSSYIPTSGSAIFQGVLGVVIGGFMLIVGASAGVGMPAFMGFVIGAILVISSISQYSKAQEYEAAERDYQDRRSRIQSGQAGGGFNFTRLRQ